MKANISPLDGVRVVNFTYDSEKTDDGTMLLTLETRKIDKEA
jgi:hypothetical protein